MGVETSPQSASGVRIRPNVIAVQLEDLRLPEADLRARLFYWDLVELARVSPMRFPSIREESLTVRQREEKDGFMRPAKEHALHLWPNIPAAFQPMPITHSPNEITESLVARTPHVSRPHPSKLESSPTKVALPGVVENPLEPAEVSAIDARPVSPSATDVLESAISSRFVVLAPPGTGKTHLMLDRVTQLIHSRAVRDPHAEVLVLSFTRVTVADIGRKLSERVEAGAPDAVRYVDVRTFDSLATSLLLLEENGQELLVPGFDERINRVTRGLQENRLNEAQERLGQVRYLVIDEVQDLTGVRAAFCLALIAHLSADAGILLLGDPLQAIYDFNADSWTAQESLSALRRCLAPHLQTASLSQYHRFQSQALERLAENLRTAVENEEQGVRFVSTLTQSIPKASLDELAEAARTGRVAVLTRTNLEVFQLAEWARARQIPTMVRARQPYWPAWMARLVFGVKGDYISLEQFHALWSRRLQNSIEGVSALDAESLCREAGLIQRGSLDLRDFGEYLRSHVPKPAVEGTGLVVSTIHQSKGLEYDAVALLAPARNANFGGRSDELRVLYVAATRATRRLVLLERDRAVFKRGRKGPSNHFNHFHGYVDSENRFLVNTKEDYSLQDFWYGTKTLSRQHWIQGIGHRQDDWWKQFQSPGVWSVPWALKDSQAVAGPSSILKVATTLLRDLSILHRGFGQASQGVVEARVTELVTVAGPADADPDVFGTARVAIIPWVFGWARVVAEEENT